MLPLPLVLSVCLVAGPATSNNDVVDAAIELAKAHAAAGDFEQALATVRDTRRLSDDPALILVEAQTLWLSGNCRDAMALYDVFIATNPSPEDRKFAASYRMVCQQTVLLEDANRLRDAGDCAGAVERYTELLASKPEEPQRKSAQDGLAGCRHSVVLEDADRLRAAGKCEAANERYRDFIAIEPPQPEREAAAAKIQTCVAVGPAIAPPATTAATANPAPTDQPRRQLKDPTGVALWVGGGVVATTGIGLFAGSWGQRGRSRRDMPTLDAYLDRERRARTIGGVGIAAMSVGASVLIFAAVRHALRSARDR